MRKRTPYTGRERRQRTLYRVTAALWMLAAVLLLAGKAVSA